MPVKKIGICDKTCRIFTKAEHESIGEAITADIVDAIPIIGTITDFARISDLEHREGTAYDLAFISYLIDAIPVLGDIADIIAPTNTLLYLFKNKGVN